MCAQWRDLAEGAYTASEDIGASIRVKLNSTIEKSIAIAGAGEPGIGVTSAPIANTAIGRVREWSKEGTFKITAADSFAANAPLYPAAAGKFTDTQAGCGDQMLQALEAATAVNGVVEALVSVVLGETSIGAITPIDDNGAGTDAGTSQITMSSDPIDDDMGGTDGGTENFVATTVEIDDDTTGTDAGTEQLNPTVAGAVDNDTAGTDGGTEQLAVMTFTAGSAPFLTPIKNNFTVLANQVNAIAERTNNNLAVLAAQINAAKVDQANVGAVSAKEFNELRDDTVNGFKVITNAIDAILAAATSST